MLNVFSLLPTEKIIGHELRRPGQFDMIFPICNLFLKRIHGAFFLKIPSFPIGT